MACGENIQGQYYTPTPFATASSTATAQASATPLPTTAANTGSRTLAMVLADTPTQVFIPSNVSKDQNLQVLVVLHGMNGNGIAMSQGLLEYAEKYKWVVVAPTINYDKNWQNVEVVSHEDPALALKINEMLDDLPGILDLKLNHLALLLGFSRGAQLAHRYAMMYPERTLAVTTISAGSYTLPLSELPTNSPKPKELPTTANTSTFAFPYGVGDIANYTGHPFNRTDFKKIKFWVEVGELDNKNNDVSRVYDPYIGANRVERARSFYTALQQAGVTATFNIYPGAGHEVTSEMRKQACNFFRSLNKVQIG
jgi:pimeloyl-ACP methyl ester carboxylesterase